MTCWCAVYSMLINHNTWSDESLIHTHNQSFLFHFISKFSIFLFSCFRKLYHFHCLYCVLTIFDRDFYFSYSLYSTVSTNVMIKMPHLRKNDKTDLSQNLIDKKAHHAASDKIKFEKRFARVFCVFCIIKNIQCWIIHNIHRCANCVANDKIVVQCAINSIQYIDNNRLNSKSLSKKKHSKKKRTFEFRWRSWWCFCQNC